MLTAAATNSQVPLQDKIIHSEGCSDLSITDQKVNQHVTSFLSINVAWEILALGLKKETLYQTKLAKSTNEASEIQQTIQKLIELNGELSISEKDVVLSDRAINLCKELEKAQITLIKPGEKKISPARMGELKAQIGSQNDRLKTQLQTLFTTKIQVMINEMNSLLESLRTIHKFFDRLMSNIISNMKR